MNDSVRELIIWGASGHAKVLLECLRSAGKEVVAFVDANSEIASPAPGKPVLHGKAGLEKWLASRSPKDALGFLVAIGGDKGRDRIEIQDYLEGLGLMPVTAIHQTAFVAENCRIGSASHVLAHAAVCVETVLGRNCIINTGASVDHECNLGDGTHVAPGARLAGCVTVGRFAMIGTGAVVLPRKTVGEGAVVGAGAVVVKDVDPYTVVVGNPARLLRAVPH